MLAVLICYGFSEKANEFLDVNCCFDLVALVLWSSGSSLGNFLHTLGVKQPLGRWHLRLLVQQSFESKLFQGLFMPCSFTDIIKGEDVLHIQIVLDKVLDFSELEFLDRLLGRRFGFLLQGLLFLR